MAKVILQDVLVLAAGQTVETRDNRAVSVATVTVALTPEQTERLALAQSEGRLTLATRNLKDSAIVSTRGATVSSLFADGPPPAAMARESAPRPAPRPATVLPPPKVDSFTVSVLRGGKASDQHVRARGRGAGPTRPIRSDEHERDGRPWDEWLAPPPDTRFRARARARRRRGPVRSEAQEPNARLYLMMDRSKILDLSEPVTKISVTNPGIADVNVLSPTSILLSGKAAGATSLLLFSAKRVQHFDLIVQSRSRGPGGARHGGRAPRRHRAARRPDHEPVLPP